MEKLYPYLPTIAFVFATAAFIYLAWTTVEPEKPTFRWIAASLFGLAALSSIIGHLRSNSTPPTGKPPGSIE